MYTRASFSLTKNLMAGILLSGILSLGTVSAAWENATGNLAGMPSECGNLCLLSVVPGKDVVIAGIAKQGLWQSADGGATWTAIGKDTGSDSIVNRPSRILYDPANPNIFYESGIYNGSGVYKTADGGKTFLHLGKIGHNDYISVDFSDPKRLTMLAGGHEQSQKLWKSEDGGQNWVNIGLNLPAGTKFSSNPLLLDKSTYLVNAAGWGKGTGGIYRTTDGGATWQPASTLEPSGAPLVASDGAIYWELLWDKGLIRSTDQGKTWEQVCGYGVIKCSTIIELPGGKLCTIGAKCIKISSDKGATWTQFGDPTPVQPAGVVYSPTRKALYIWHWNCGAQVLPDAIFRNDYPPKGN
ncbi:MAG: hypothetical protein WCD79_10000 [Chthoniobacteraceae bacterium]